MARLDIYLTEKGLAGSREKAKQLITGGRVTVNGTAVTKPAFSVPEGAEVNVSAGEDYVGRGAYKLLKAFEVFPIDVHGKLCADIGASTGGFTQVLLEKGAAKVWAVDVGHGQLDPKLCADSRVVNCEGVNVRYLPPDFFGTEVTFACCDLSFISLTQILPALTAALPENAEVVTLIKPQFEAGRAALNKSGVVKDKRSHTQVLESLAAFFPTVGLTVCGLDYSPISGGDGNIEYLAFLKKGTFPAVSIDFKRLVDKAFADIRSVQK